MLKRDRGENPSICCRWLNCEGCSIFHLSSLFFPWVNDYLQKRVRLYLPKEKICSEYRNSTDTWGDIGLLFIVDIFHIKDETAANWNCSPPAKPYGIRKTPLLLALSSCQSRHSPFFLHFIINVLTRIYNVEARIHLFPVTKHYTDWEDWRRSELKLGLWRMILLGKDPNPSFLPAMWYSG